MEADAEQSQWLVLQVRPSAERTTSDRIVQAGFMKPFVPLIEESDRVIRGRRVRPIVPMFPTYILQAVPLVKGPFDVLVPSRLYDLRAVDGVVRILQSVAVHHGFVEGLLASLGPDGVFRAPRVDRTKRYLPKQTVRVIDGPFDSFKGKFVKMCGRDRCRVLLNLFGRRTEAILQLDQLAAA